MTGIGRGIGLVLGLASLALGGAASAADLQVELSGAGSSSGAPLSATITIDVTGPSAATLHITNTSPASSAALPDAPVLTRVGLNLADPKAASCLSVASPGNWSLSNDSSPFCGMGGASSCGKGGKGGKGGDSSKPFQIELQAANPAPKHGVSPGETLDLQLVLGKSCKCGGALTVDTFLDAPVSPSGGQLVQWATKFQVVGTSGNDSGCAQGDVDIPPPPPPSCQPTYTWSEFIATAAENTPWPSDVALMDTRAGSVEYNFNGGFGFGGPYTDAPFDAAILTIRNGLSAVLEQFQFNRRWPDAIGCQTLASFVRCWIFEAVDVVDQVLSAAVPTWSGGSNTGHDSSGSRVEISGELYIDYKGGDVHGDNSHEAMTVTWYAPKGLATAQLLLRGRYDWNLDDLNASDPMVPLFRRNVTGYQDMQDPAIVIVSETATTLTIALNAQAGLVRVCEAYAEAGFLTPDGVLDPAYATVGGPGGEATTGGSDGGDGSDGSGGYATVGGADGADRPEGDGSGGGYATTGGSDGTGGYATTGGSGGTGGYATTGGSGGTGGYATTGGSGDEDDEDDKGSKGGSGDKDDKEGKGSKGGSSGKDDKEGKGSKGGSSGKDDKDGKDGKGSKGGSCSSGKK